MTGNSKCKNLCHPLHICALKGAGLEDRQLTELTDRPKFRCEICGATAQRAEHLCNPKKI